jgi:YVTN family beta-propeller protein
MAGPTGAVAFDSSGNLWVADYYNNRVLEFSPPFTSGMAASLVLGQPGFTSSTGTTTATGMKEPFAVTFDQSGNLWVSDMMNNRVLEFVKGSGFTNGQAASVVLGQPNFTASAMATNQTGLWEPAGVAFDQSGDLWVADMMNSRVLEFTPPFTNGMAASTVLGEPSFDTSSGSGRVSQYSMWSPQGVAVDSSGNLWVADTMNSRVLEFTPPFANGMAASFELGQSARFNGPESLGFDPSGNLWVADSDNNRVLEFAKGSGFTSDQGASLVLGQSAATSLYIPTGVAVDSSGDVWVSDSGNGRVLEFSASSTTTVTTTTSASATATVTVVTCSPSTISMGSETTCTAEVTGASPTGDIAFATSSPNGGSVTPSSASCSLSDGACSVAFRGSVGHTGSVTVRATYSGDPQNLESSNTYLVAVVKYTTSTNIDCVPSLLQPGESAECAVSVSDSLSVPAGVGPIAAAYDPANGYVYVADYGEQGRYVWNWGDTVSVLNGSDGSLVTKVNVGLYPDGVAYDARNGLIYVSNGGSDTVSVISGLNNTVVKTVTVRSIPYGIAYDPANGYVYVSNYGNDTISVIDGASNSEIAVLSLRCQAVVGCGPAGIAYDSADGYIYIANQLSDPGTISVYDASTNTYVTTIDWNPSNTKLSIAPHPTAITFDPYNGLLYAVSPADNSVYVIDGADINTTAGSCVHTETCELSQIVPIPLYGTSLTGIAFDPNNGGMIYAASDEYGNVAVVDGVTNSYMGTVQAGIGASGIAVDTANGFIFVANEFNDSVSVIEPVSLSSPEEVTFSQSGSGSVSLSSATCTLDASGDCWVNATGLNTGSVTIEANYAGDGNYNGSSGVFTLDVAVPTSTSVECTPSTVDTGSQTTCEATVSGSSPTGTVAFTSLGKGTFTPNSCSLLSLSTSSAACSVTYTPNSSGSPVKIAGYYGGDTNNQPSSGTFSLKVIAVASTSVVCTPSSVSSGSQTTCVATVVGNSPTGTVAFSSSESGTFSSGSCSLSGGTCSVTYTPSSSKSPVTIKGSYGGDANNEPSSGTFSLEVTASASCKCTKTGPFVDASLSNQSPDVITDGTFPSPDGSSYAGVTSVEGTFYLNVTKGSSVLVQPVDNPLGWGWSPDSRFFVVDYRPYGWSSDQFDLSVYDLDGSSPSTPTIFETVVSGAATWGFSPDSAKFLLFYTDSDNYVQIDMWGSSSGQQLVSSLSAPLATIQFSPCGDLLMVGELTSSTAASSSGPIGSASFYETWAFNTVYETVNILTTPYSASVGQDSAGNFIVKLTGMDTPSFPSPQCTHGASTTPTTPAGAVPTKTSVDCTPDSVDEDSPTECTAKVSSSSSSSPYGTITWDTSGEGDFSSEQCGLVSGECSVTYTPSNEESAKVIINATYVPGEDSNFKESNGTFSLTVNIEGKEPTETSVSCTPDSDSGNYTCNATVTGEDPTGTVDFSVTEGPDQLGSSYFSPESCSLSSGECSVTYNPHLFSDEEGTATVKAEYDGDPFNAPSADEVSVNYPSSTATETSSSEALTTTSVVCFPVPDSTEYVCTATVTGNNPDGSVDFSLPPDITDNFSPTWCILHESSGECAVTFDPYVSSDEGGTAKVEAMYNGDPHNSKSEGYTTVTYPPNTATTAESQSVCSSDSSDCDMEVTSDPAYVLVTNLFNGEQAGCDATGLVVNTIPGASVENTNSSAPNPCSMGTERITIPSPIADLYSLQVFSVGPSSSFTITVNLTSGLGTLLGSTTYSGSVSQGAPANFPLTVGFDGSLSVSSVGGTEVPQFPLSQDFLLALVCLSVVLVTALRRFELSKQ